MIVDDDPEAIFILRRAVEKVQAEHPILTFGDGAEVIQFLSAVYSVNGDEEIPLPCLLLLDLKMPVMTGFDVLAWLQEIDQFSSMLRVVVSSSDAPEDMARARRLGASQYLFKFPRPETINSLIHSACSPVTRPV